MIPCVCIFGPTASGKSSLALKLAQKTKGTIISADSMQIYRGMDVGTAKPTAEERNLVPHKMIDILDPNESYSVYDFKADATKEIQNAWSRSSLPVVAGGTGLYIDALLNNTQFGEMEIDEDVLSSLNLRAANGEAPDLLRELNNVDPETAAPLHEKDVKRIVRALAVYRSTGKTLTSFKRRSHDEKSDIDFLSFYLCFHDRDSLYQRIDDRVDAMLDAGLLEEACLMKESGVLREKTASQAIAYKELVPFLEGEKPLDECVSLLKQKSRNYAKRQITWFKRYESAVCVFMDDEEDPFNTIYERCKEFLKRYES